MATAVSASGTSQQLAALLDRNREGIYTCVHCGLCLPACPTYRELGNENDSPRGRVYLMRAVVEGRLELRDAFTAHIDLCLGCRACETVCPSGVPYGELLEAARAEIANSGRVSLTRRVIRVVLNHLFTRPRLLSFAMALARILRDSGLPRLALESGLVSGRPRLALAMLLASKSSKAGEAPRNVANDEITSKVKVAVLHGCVMEGLFAGVNRATERVLRKTGCEVVEAPGESCCGALHAHAGELETAKRLARKNIDAFAAAACDRVIVNAAGCGAAMKEYKHLLADDKVYAARAVELSKKVRDVSEFLVETGLKPMNNSIRRRVAYDAPCHLIHAQRIANAPLDLLRQVPGVELVLLEGSESCCGGAGIYNLQHEQLSSEILSEKIDNVLAGGAEMVVTGNPGCIMQIGAGLLLRGSAIEVAHPIELIDQAYSGSPEKG